MNTNFPPGTLPQDIDGAKERECLYCFQVATHNINGAPYCQWHYEQENSNNEWIEENETPRTNDNTTTN